jgi:hypothetical protein
MFNTIFSPLTAIDAAKKERNMTKTMWMLVVSSLLMGVAALIIALQLGTEIVISILILVGFAIGIFLSNLFNAWIYQFTINTISGKGTYYDTLTALTNSAFVMSVGIFIASILLLIPLFGVIFALILVLLTMILAYAVLIRTLTFLSGADLLSVIVGMGVIVMASLVTAYLAALITVLALGSMPLAATGGLGAASYGSGVLQ